jgi:hypothetical protein
MQQQKVSKNVIRAQTYSRISLIFPTKADLRRDDFAQLLSVTKEHISNLEVDEEYLVKPYYVGRIPYYDFDQVVDFITDRKIEAFTGSSTLISEQVPSAPAKKVGRPSHKSRAAAEKAGGV